jgi:stage II sporulation protein D
MSVKSNWKFLLQSSCWGTTLFLGLASVTQATALEMRVGIVEDAGQITVGSSTTAKVIDASGRMLGELKPLERANASAVGGSISVAGKQSSQFWIQPADGGFVYIGDRWYQGRTKLTRTSQGVTAINYVDLEDYIASVVGKEMYPTWPEEALKAQSVASRSFALFRRDQQLKRNSPFDVGDTVANQVYDGINSETITTQNAAAATRGQVLTYNGQIIEAAFHAASGGHTENSENIWTKAVPYLRGVPDFDQTAPVYQWNLSFTAAQMRQRLPGIGNIMGLRPLQTSPQGRILKVQVVGDAGSRTMKGSQLRSALGLKSTLFAVTPQMGLMAASSNSIPAAPVAFQFAGQGSGHGIGMSQWGAYAMAQQGQSYQQILQHYYQGTQIGGLPGVR